MTINSKAISNKPDYRPDLLAKNHTNRNIFLFIAVAVPFVIYTFFTVIEIDNENQKYRTKTNDTTVQKLPQPNKTIKNISNNNTFFKCTDINGAVMYQNTCPSSSKSQAIEIYQISGVQAYKPMTDSNSYSDNSSSAAIFDREKETCKKRVQEKIKNLKKNRSFSKSELKLLEQYEQELRNCLL